MSQKHNTSNALAAVDLGSNSFHMLVAREVDGELRVVDRLRERVGLAEGLRPDRKLDGAVAERALACLERFGQRIASVPQDRARAVGTATFRRLKDRGAFRRSASKALGLPIEVVPGREEARLVYLGVAHALGDESGRRLVVDIGGGSTELILGERFSSHAEDSLALGCVTWSRRYFPDDEFTHEAMSLAELDGRLELAPVAERYRAGQWDDAIGSSGTARAIGQLLEAHGWSDGTITRDGLDRLTARIIDAGTERRLDLKELRADRRKVIAGGVAVMRAVFASLGVTTMRTSNGALREGLLYDLIGRIHHEDVRETSARAFLERLGIDARHGERTRALAEALFDQVADDRGLRPVDRELLGRAALLHAIGLAVSHSGHHKHGAYLIENSDLAGFSREERRELAILVRGHRRAVRAEMLEDLPPDRADVLRDLLPLLRIAARLRRDRSDRDQVVPEMEISGTKVSLHFPAGWLADNPLTLEDLRHEAKRLEVFGVKLVTD